MFLPQLNFLNHPKTNSLETIKHSSKSNMVSLFKRNQRFETTKIKNTSSENQDQASTQRPVSSGARHTRQSRSCF